MFPMALRWREWVRARRKRDQANKLWRTETWLDVTYLLSNLSGQSWGRTGQVHFVSKTHPLFFHYSTAAQPLSQSYSTSLPVSLLTHKHGFLNQCRLTSILSKENHIQVLEACPSGARAKTLLCIINPWFYCCKSLFINNQMVYIYFHIMCVHVSLCTPTLFGKWGDIWDVCFSWLPIKEGPALIQKLVLKNLMEVNFAFCYCSPPDCLKLPHADKQSEKLKSELNRN